MSADYTHMMTAAEARTACRDWSDAASTYSKAAEIALQSGRAEAAWRAWSASGECWRRDDRPVQAERCLRRALELTEPSGTAAAATAPGLAASLADVGATELAEDLLESIACEQVPGSVPATFLDTRVGLLIALGRKEAARLQLHALRSVGRMAGAAPRFREAQLQVLDGDLSKARGSWRRLVVELHRQEQSAGLAAGLASLAEVELLLGAEREAMARFQASAEAWREAGRPAPAWASEAGRVRAMVALGVHPLPGMLDEALQFAQERELVPLGIGLRIARGIALAERDHDRADEDLSIAMEDAMSAGLPVLVGTAAYERAVRLSFDQVEQKHLLDTAAMALVSHVPLAARVALARARLLARFDPVQSRAVARACLPLLDRMGMSRDALAARALVRQLG